MGGAPILSFNLISRNRLFYQSSLLTLVIVHSAEQPGVNGPRCFVIELRKFNIKRKKNCSLRSSMEETSVEQLIEKLRALQLETARTIELLELARGDEDRNRQRRASRTPTVVATPVATPVTNTNFSVGDRVIITNRVRGNHDRRATVTSVSDNRVTFRTDDGHHTWRAPGNLRLLAAQR